MINVLPSQYHDVLTAFDVLIFARRDILFFQITREVVSSQLYDLCNLYRALCKDNLEDNINCEFALYN